MKVKEGQPIGLTCASLQDVNDLFSSDLTCDQASFLFRGGKEHLIQLLDYWLVLKQGTENRGTGNRGMGNGGSLKWGISKWGISKRGNL